VGTAPSGIPVQSGQEQRIDSIRIRN